MSEEFISGKTVLFANPGTFWRIMKIFKVGC